MIDMRKISYTAISEDTNLKTFQYSFCVFCSNHTKLSFLMQYVMVNMPGVFKIYYSGELDTLSVYSSNRDHLASMKDQLLYHFGHD